jgi:hypothetical protein
MVVMLGTLVIGGVVVAWNAASIRTLDAAVPDILADAVAVHAH